MLAALWLWTLRVQLQGSRWRTAPFCILLDASSFHGVGFVVSARLPAASCILWVTDKRCSWVFLLWFRCAQSSTQSSLQQLFGSFVSMTPQGVADLYLSSQGRQVVLCNYCVVFALQCASVHSPFCWFLKKSWAFLCVENYWCVSLRFCTLRHDMAWCGKVQNDRAAHIRLIEGFMHVAYFNLWEVLHDTKDWCSRVKARLLVKG